MIMKKLLMIALSIVSLNVIAQDTPTEINVMPETGTKVKYYGFRDGVDSLNPWKITGNLNVGFNQAAFKNWAPGGTNLIGISAIGFLKTAYDKKKLNWTSTIDVGYGTQKLAKQDFRKNDDRLEINSQLNYKARKKLYYALLMNFRSQFAKGYTYPDDTTKTLSSKFMSPGFLIVGLGVDYKPSDWFHVFISPVTSKSVFVLDNVNIDPTQYGLDPGEKVFQNFGAFLSASLNKEVVKNVTINTQLNLFSNYLKEPQNIDINWLTSINLKVNKFLSVAIVTEYVYDHDIDVPKVKEDGTAYKGKGGQFREVLTIGLGYQFNNEKKQTKLKEEKIKLN
jgi:hypothetical protein